MTEKEIIKAHLKAMAIFDANNTVMSVQETSRFLKLGTDTIYKRLKEGTPEQRIYGVYQGGWKIPKIQFLNELIDDWEQQL